MALRSRTEPTPRYFRDEETGPGRIRLIVNGLGNAHTEGEGQALLGGFPIQYLDKALELCVLLQESSLLLFKREDVFCCLLENCWLRARG